MRAEGAWHTDSREALNTEGVPTPGAGTCWWPSHITRLLQTYDAKPLTAGRPTGSHSHNAKTIDHDSHAVENQGRSNARTGPPDLPQLGTLRVPN